MRILSLKKTPLEQAISEAITALKEGGIVAYPTESYYALGVTATDESAIKRVCELKQRPADKAMPVIIGDRAALKVLAEQVPEEAEALMKRFWPGPLTLIFMARKGLPELLAAGTGKVAARIPGEGFALSLAIAAGFPITATSANISSMPPADNPKDIIRYFGEMIDLIIDGGKTPGGKPSTIVDVTVSPMRVLREGRTIVSF
ncbi:MAG: threonylcarbamoyl-AMP synthase [Nitrospirae bacterium]|nr:threonylcarbamoyl-AMP synthase [Nitrospirota bacterium]